MEANRRTLGTAWLLAVPRLLRHIFVVISEKRKKNRSSQKEELPGESAVFLRAPQSQEWGCNSHLSLASRKAFANGLYLIFRAVI